MLGFHPFAVTSVERVAEDAVCVSLAVPPALREAYAYHAGQYLTVRRVIAGREERRTYSIVTPPGGAVLKLGVRLQRSGGVSAALGELCVGEVLEVGKPMGRFHTKVDPSRARTYVAIAAGSGITPVLSLAAHILAQEPGSGFTLIYGNRSMSRTMFLEETLALKNRYLGRFAVHFVMSREPQHMDLMNGRIDAAKLGEFARRIPAVAAADEYFLCGPGSMVEELRTAITDFNPAASIKVERFAAGPSPGAAALRSADQRETEAVGVAAAARELLATVSITLDGRRRTFPMAPDDLSVLEAAERAGFELPFSCRAGICATCRARVVDGQAVMAHNIALAPWELAAGFILCCQARPTSAVLELSYDDK